MIGTIVGGGFRLMRQRPAAVAVWGLVYLLTVVATTFLTRSLFTGMAGGAAVSPLGSAGAEFGKLLLFELAVLVVMTVLLAAVQRAVLQPERSAFAYLRLGMDEVRLFALAIILLVLFYILMLVTVIVLAAIVGLIAAASGVGALGPVMLATVVGMIALVLFLEVRFALAFPLTLLRGKIIIGEAWRVTRGRFWSLFAGFFLLTLIVFAVVFAASLVTTGGMVADLIRGGFDPAGAAAQQQAMMAQQLGPVNGTTILGWILGGFAGTFAFVLFGGGVAAAARELTGNVDDIAETFA
jgi:hypothetical protein